MNLKITLLLALLPLVQAQSQVCLMGNDEDNHSHQYFKVIAPSGIVVRAEPNRASAKLGAIPSGEEILVCHETQISETIEGRQGNWLKIGWLNKPAYVFGGFLESVNVPKIEMFIPNAGVDYGWDCASFDPEKTWTALVDVDSLRPPEAPHYHFSKKKLKLGKKVSNHCGGITPEEVENAPLNFDKAPFAVFTGFKLKEGLIRRGSFGGTLFPGTVQSFHVYDEKEKVEHGYCLFVKGNVIQNEEMTNFRQAGPISRIENYEIWLYHSVELSHYNSSNEITKQCLFRGNLTNHSFDCWRFVTLNVCFAGDIDGDGLLDLILQDNFGDGTSFDLYLSSKALPGFLLRHVASLVAAGC